MISMLTICREVRWGWGVKDINVPKKNRRVLSISFPEAWTADLCNSQIIISDYNFLTDIRLDKILRLSDELFGRNKLLTDFKTLGTFKPQK